MEFGALICKKKPLCAECPLQGWCAAYALDNVNERPVKGKSVGITSLQVVTGIVVHEGRVFIQKRLETGGWAGLWEFPGGRVETGEENLEAVVRELQEETDFEVQAEDFLGTITHSYTRYKIALHCYLCRLDVSALKDLDVMKESLDAFPVPNLSAATAYAWEEVENLGEYPLPAPHRRLVEKWGERIQAFCEQGR